MLFDSSPEKPRPIEVLPAQEYIIGKGFIKDIDDKSPPCIWLMLPIYREEDVTRPMRILVYQYRNYWGIYHLGPISKFPLVVNIFCCLFDRITSKGYPAHKSAENAVEFMGDYRYYVPDTLIKHVRGLSHPPNKKSDTFESYITSDMSENAIKNAFWAARGLASACQLGDMRTTIYQTIAETYIKCRDDAAQKDIRLQVVRPDTRKVGIIDECEDLQ